MKKPFLSLKTKKEKRTMLLSLSLSFVASILFFLPEKSIPVFAEGNNVGAISSLFEIVKLWL